MALIKEFISSGDLLGVKYIFEFAGDEVPEHSHEIYNTHVIIVAKGRILLKLEGHPDYEIEAGDMYDISPMLKHSLIALDDDTVTYHYIMYPMGGQTVHIPLSTEMYGE